MRILCAVSLIAALATACNKGDSGAAAGQKPRAPSVAKADVSSDPRALCDARYRLGPDRRVVMAAADADHLLGGSGAQIEASWRGNAWALRQGAQDLGTLPELPMWSDYARWLDAVVAAHHREQPAPQIAAPKEAILSTRAALRVAQDAGSRFTAGPTRAQALADGVHALVSLVVQSPDPMGRNDAVAARALALVAIARAEHALAPGDEALLASAMGYSGGARALAANLPANDPVHAFVFVDDAALERDLSLPARLLRLRRFVLEDDRDGAISWIQKRLAPDETDLPALAARLELGGFDDIRQVALATPALLARHARQVGAAAATTPVELAGLKLVDALRRLAAAGSQSSFAQLDAGIAAIPRAGNLGPFLAALGTGDDLARSTYRAFGYASIYSLATWAGAELASMPLLDQLTAEITQGGSFADAAQWVHAYRGAASSTIGRPELARVIDTTPFGDRAVRRLLVEARKSFDWGSVDSLAIVRAAARHLDSRPVHRYWLADLAQVVLADIALAERLVRSLTAEDPDGHPASRVWVAAIDGKLAGLKPLLHDARVPLTDRWDLLEGLIASKTLSEAESRAELTRFAPEMRGQWAYANRWIAFLEKQHDWDGARRVAEEFLRTSTHEGLSDVFAGTAIARTLYQQKRYAEAWKRIEPLLRSWQRGAMMRGALILQALGRSDEAIALAKQQLDRYPTSPDAVGVVAEVYWRAGKPADAAAALAHPPRPITSVDWRWTIGPHLRSVIDDGVDVHPIFAALATSGIDPLAQRALVQGINEGHTHDAIFVELMPQIRMPGMERLEAITDAAASVQRQQGAAAASAWLRRAVPPPLLGPLSQFAYARHLDDALWTVVPKQLPGDPGHDASVWLFRAAASLRAGANDPHRAELLEHYRGDSPSYYHTIGKHLVGLADEATVLALANAPKPQAEVAYYLGLKADAERRLVDAERWYRTSVETGQQQVFEVRVAYDRLAEWRSSGKSLARLAALPCSSDTTTP